MKSPPAPARAAHPPAVSLARLATSVLVVLAVALALTAASDRRTEVTFSLCHRKLPGDGSAAGPSGRATRDALEHMIDALARELARTQPSLQKRQLPLQDPVPYDLVTGSKEKLYRYIER